VAIDPDGVGAMTQYAPNQTDVATTSNGLGDVSRTLSWDAVGNALQTADPLGNVSYTTYDFADHATDVTAPDGTVSHTVYNKAGQPTAVYANYSGGGSPQTGDQNLETTNTYDSLGNGWVVTTVSDPGSGHIAATTNKTYDLQGAVVTTTVYPGPGTGGTARTTTSHFDCHDPSLSVHHRLDEPPNVCSASSARCERGTGSDTIAVASVVSPLELAGGPRRRSRPRFIVAAGHSTVPLGLRPAPLGPSLALGWPRALMPEGKP
jgi:YD repeat-containing protein